MNLNPFSSPPMVGLDIQMFGIKFITLSREGRQYRVKQYAGLALPATIFTDGKIKEWDTLSQVLTELVSDHDLQGTPAAIAIPVNLVRMQQIRLPVGMADADIEAEIMLQLQRDLPGMTDPLWIDFVIKSSTAIGYNEVFFAATRQEYLNHYIACVNAAGLRVKVVDIDIHALDRATKFEIPTPAPEYLLACGLALREVPRW